MLSSQLPRYFLLSGLALCGCASPPQPSTPPHDSARALQDQRQEYFQAWMKKADFAQTAFLTCVKSYAANHQQTTLTATELSGAAVSACNRELAEYRNDEQALYILIDPNTPAYPQADRAVAQLTDRAKGIVLQMMAERPPRAP